MSGHRNVFISPRAPMPGPPYLVPDVSQTPTLSSELWHACAGPLVTLPFVGSKVVYFPQGHLEQADVETEHVYAQMTLQPLTPEETNEEDDDSYYESQSRPEPSAMFCKMLTASDTSTHGGFSIPRKSAEMCLPALDYNNDPPAQSLVARDLQGYQWKFRHIYRGFPKRHLLTTGWTSYVTKKKLMSGDYVMFVRTDNGELRIGCRRSIKNNSSRPSSIFTFGSIHLGVLASASHALATQTPFTVSYSPRTSPSAFVIPFKKFRMSLRGPPGAPGLRFRMPCETDEATSRRFRGTVIAVNNFDQRWPNSLWRALEVSWDEGVEGERQERVSIWEIEPHITHPVSMSDPSFMRTHKRMRPDASVNLGPQDYSPYGLPAALGDDGNGWQSEQNLIPGSVSSVTELSPGQHGVSVNVQTPNQDFGPPTNLSLGVGLSQLEENEAHNSNGGTAITLNTTLDGVQVGSDSVGLGSGLNQNSLLNAVGGGNVGNAGGVNHVLNSIQVIRDVLSKADPVTRNFIMQQFSGSQGELGGLLQGLNPQSSHVANVPERSTYVNNGEKDSGRLGNYLSLSLGPDLPRQHSSSVDLDLRLSSATGLGSGELQRNAQMPLSLGMGQNEMTLQQQSHQGLHLGLGLGPGPSQGQMLGQMQEQLQGQLQYQGQVQGNGSKPSGSVNLSLGLG